MQPAEAADAFVPGTKIEVIGVAEQNLHTQFGERLLREAFHGSGRAYGHKRRRIDHAVRRGEAAETRAGRIGF